MHVRRRRILQALSFFGDSKNLPMPADPGLAFIAGVVGQLSLRMSSNPTQVGETNSGCYRGSP